MKNGLINGNTKHSNNLKWSLRSLLRRNVIIIALLSAISVLIIVMMYLLFSVKVEICTTAACVRTSMELLQYINPKADPCEDFYLFACGNYTQNIDLDNAASYSFSKTAEEDVQIKIESMLLRPSNADDRMVFMQAKNFYQACMNVTQIKNQGLRGMRGVFSVMGGWPTIREKGWREEQFEWDTALHRLRAIGVDANFFFKVDVDKSKDEGKYILGIHGMTYSPSNISRETRALYLEYMVELALLFGAKKSTAVEDSNEVLNLLLRFAKEYEIAVKQKQTGLYKLYNLSELQYNISKVSWKSYLDGILAPAAHVKYDEEIVVTEPTYLKAVINILETTDKRTLANFIAWQTLQYLMNFLPHHIEDKAYEYYEKLKYKVVRQPRWKTCVKAVQKRMDSVISAAFIEHYFPENLRRNVEEIMLNIKDQFKYNLRWVDWLDEDSKALVIDNLIKNVQDIGSYNDLMEVHIENQIYNQVEIYSDRALQAALDLEFINMNKKFENLGKPVNKNWLGKSSFVTGIYVYYSPLENRIRYPAALFSGVYYQEDRPKYVNYGILGSIIAHEMSHVFTQARDRNVPGDLRSRWSMDSLVRYGRLVECLSDQYCKFDVGEPNHRFDTEKTTDEDMADLAGVKVAYDSYLSWVRENGVESLLPSLPYTPYQLFWISTAVRHCAKFSPDVLKKYTDSYQWSLPQFRVNGPLRNLHDFVVDFDCPVGSRMNPQEKCVAW